MPDTSLGDRMKAHEAACRAVLPRRTYTLLRVDGRAFHTFTRGFEKPYDLDLMNAMDEASRTLCDEIDGAVFAYTQSDEISVLFTDLGSVNSHPWFGGVVAKQVSVAASIATASFNNYLTVYPKLAQFDARVFTISDPVEVANYFVWRQRDAVRNSVQMVAQKYFSHRQLHGLNGGQLQEKLYQEAGVNWNDYPDGHKRGRVTVRRTGPREVEYTDKRTGATKRITPVRRWWETGGAPHFTTKPGDFLADTIPAMPTLNGREE